MWQSWGSTEKNSIYLTGVPLRYFVILELLQDQKFDAVQHGFGAVVESNFADVLRVGGKIGDDGRCAGRKEWSVTNAGGVHDRFSRAIWRTSSRMSTLIGGRPAVRFLLESYFMAIKRRCQASKVSG